MKKTSTFKLPYAGELAQILQAKVRTARLALPSASPDRLDLNPTLAIVPVRWQGLAALTLDQPGTPLKKDGFVLCWLLPGEQAVQCQDAQPADLLAIKLVAEGVDLDSFVATTATPLATLTACLQNATAKGLVLAPAAKIRRDPADFDPEHRYRSSQLVANTFTLQWHITQACDLHCRHCYDRSVRQAVSRCDGFLILDQLQEFCTDRQVAGQISFSGGNPFLHPDFFDFYRGAVDRGLQTAILGNSTTREEIRTILAIRPPAYFQVSLEGLEAHNDSMRGAGHYQRTMQFLALLRELNIPSRVMLTLTRDNIAQVIPLGHELQGLTGSLSFNRLALFGEGASLALPEQDTFHSFLDAYRLASKELPVLTLKDNLLNLAYEAAGEEPFCGCAGYGCGAAFNFFALLADGEVHACRKFPSPIGSTHQQTIAAIYDSPAAVRYRAGSSACTSCSLRAVCGGCLAVTASHGLDPLVNRDPYCLRSRSTVL